MRTSISAALLTAAVVALPAGSVFAAGNGKAVTTTKRVTSRTYVGPSVDMQWGPVQVTIVVTGKTVTNLRATAPTERARSAYINGIAVPMLRKEVLQAKTVAKIKNIYGISGATMTSEAFYQSLLASLKSAHLT
ncbi:MAG TPA: FMN-binding protein [Chloroflexota bacterium]|nr:FMN-binding protein [Chloroflexota bacterium]